MSSPLTGSVLWTMVGDAMSATDWLALFHAGDRATLESCYREHFALVHRAVGTVLTGADQETVVHEVFLQLLSKPEMRGAFQGGSFAAWLRTVSKNRAIDYARRYRREAVTEPTVLEARPGGEPEAERRAQALELLERFARTEVPERWRGLFRARFIEGRSQRDAAQLLGMHRTTLAYRERRLRARLRRYILRMEPP